MHTHKNAYTRFMYNETRLFKSFTLHEFSFSFKKAVCPEFFVQFWTPILHAHGEQRVGTAAAGEGVSGRERGGIPEAKPVWILMDPGTCSRGSVYYPEGKPVQCQHPSLAQFTQTFSFSKSSLNDSAWHPLPDQSKFTEKTNRRTYSPKMSLFTLAPCPFSLPTLPPALTTILPASSFSLGHDVPCD